MKRRTFIKSSALSGIALATIPSFAFSATNLPYEELIGKGNPELFGVHYKLRKEAHHAFDKMKAEALKESINIQVVSSYRDFNHQNRIWTRKYNTFTKQGMSPENTIDKIIEYSTIPGTSRHHWGTDLDIIDGNSKQPKHVLNAEHFHGNGPFCKLKEWMDIHANSFGFYLVYTDNANRKGFKYEPWHYTFKPLSKQYLADYQKLDLIDILKQEKLIGSGYFTQEFIKNYINDNILDINPKLLS